MKHILILVFAIVFGSFIKAQEIDVSLEQLPDTSLFEAYHHIQGNDTLPYRLYRSQKADTMAEVLPSRSIQMHDALREVGNEEAVLVTYPELEHQCWDEAFSTTGLFGWLFGKKRSVSSDVQD